MSANRRQVHMARMHLHHLKMRKAKVGSKNVDSASEGPDDSGKAQKAQKNLRARKALHLTWHNGTVK